MCSFRRRVTLISSAPAPRDHPPQETCFSTQRQYRQNHSDCPGRTCRGIHPRWAFPNLTTRPRTCSECSWLLQSGAVWLPCAEVTWCRRGSARGRGHRTPCRVCLLYCPADNSLSLSSIVHATSHTPNEVIIKMKIQTVNMNTDLRRYKDVLSRLMKRWKVKEWTFPKVIGLTYDRMIDPNSLILKP